MVSGLLPTVERPQRLSEHVYSAVIEAIVEGKLPPGERLREAQMAKMEADPATMASPLPPMA